MPTAYLPTPAEMESANWRITVRGRRQPAGTAPDPAVVGGEVWTWGDWDIKLNRPAVTFRVSFRGSDWLPFHPLNIEDFHHLLRTMQPND